MTQTEQVQKKAKLEKQHMFSPQHDIISQQIAHLKNAVNHLERSNQELKDETDKVFKDAIGENIVVIARYKAKIEQLQKELNDALQRKLEENAGVDIFDKQQQDNNQLSVQQQKEQKIKELVQQKIQLNQLIQQQQQDEHMDVVQLPENQSNNSDVQIQFSMSNQSSNDNGDIDMTGSNNNQVNNNQTQQLQQINNDQNQNTGQYRDDNEEDLSTWM